MTNEIQEKIEKPANTITVRSPSDRNQGRKSEPHGIKIKNSIHEREILDMLGLGASVPAIVNKLNEKYKYNVSVATLNEYIKNYVISNKNLQASISQMLSDIEKQRSDTANKIPSSIVDLINKKRKIINEFEKRLEILKKKQEVNFEVSNEYLIEKYYTAIHNIEQTIEKYLIEHEIESLLAHVLRRLLAVSFDTFLVYVPAEMLDEVATNYKNKIMSEFKNVRDKIYSGK